MFSCYRRALEDTLEQTFRPAIAAVVAFVDPQRNLKLAPSGDLGVPSRFTDLWMKLFTHCDLLGLNFKRLTHNLVANAVSLANSQMHVYLAHFQVIQDFKHSEKNLNEQVLLNV